jgi:hypothetical protein
MITSQMKKSFKHLRQPSNLSNSDNSIKDVSPLKHTNQNSDILDEEMESVEESLISYKQKRSGIVLY